MQTLVKRWRWAFVIAMYLTLLSGGWLIGQHLFEFAAIDVRPGNEPMVHRLILIAMLVFVFASAVPFVPGAEVGFALLMVLGARVALLVYAGMVIALLLAFMVGRLVPALSIASALAACGFLRAQRLVLRLAPLDANARLALLVDGAPRRIVPFLLRHRHLGLMALLNLPGNSLVGGGGGIALCAGMSGLFHLPGFLAAILLAAAPVPLIFLFGLAQG
ncbi:hypothetical protein LPB72_11100 [Hydrogenophaga crassostreae]|uniref:TVP38/TMEM64 family membrane protein n=1 Tax=Hydrogenophaga crassostreae TaxID=1763535 RepID=A0A167HWS0_9BURK|nr:hypothetical protein [Hydrogenophaga crassostreae]AOW13546.1 hypothetical protein LPB072_12480 [Hydrogenophaga crassostreae]OAD41839.1 hypothetical protein LPB72_11100 [Hydrogenophaga crassostreae]